MLRRIGIRLFLSLLLLSSLSAAQSNDADDPNGEKLLQRIAQSMKRYSRDISEIPIQVRATTSKYDEHGSLRKQRTDTHRMQYVKRYVKGDRVVRELTWKRSLFHWVSTDEANADSSTSLFALLFDNGVIDSTHTYALAVHSKSNSVDLHIGHRVVCNPFDPMNVKQRLWCGEADLRLSLDTLTPLRGSFHESGLPHEFDGIVYLNLHFDEEFQFVPVQGSREPLLLPAKVVVEWETERGKTRIESTYSVAPESGH